MIKQQHKPILLAGKLNTTKVFFILAITIWIAHFWHAQSFGLYEDDWYLIPDIIQMNITDLVNAIINLIGVEGIQNRLPILRIFVHLFSFVGLKLGGIPGIYGISYLIITVNALLFYLLLNRVFANSDFAFLGALAFCLFPADTTKSYLTHSLGMQPALTFLLLAFNCYFSQKTALSYLIILTTLFTYETAFPVFVAAPLLQKDWHAKLVKELLRHIIVLGLIIFGVFILRKSVGEHSVSSFNFLQTLLLISNPITGPITSMAMFVYRPLETLLRLKRELLIILSWYFLALSWILLQLKLKISNSTFEANTIFSKKVVQFSKFPSYFPDFAKAIVIGLTMLILAYPLTLSTLGFAISGRGTRTHFTAIFGASILCACACSFILNQVAYDQNKKRLATMGLAGFFTLLVGFGLNVQQDYQMAWQFQRRFWTDIVRLSPDMQDGTAIFVEPSGLPDNRQYLFLRKKLKGVPDTRQIKFLRIREKVLPRIYEFPDNWQIPPRVYRLPIDWQQQIVADENLFEVSEAVPEKNKTVQRQVKSSNVIFIETKNGKLTRRNKPLIIGQQKFPLKQLTDVKPPSFPKKPFYDYLIIDSAYNKDSINLN